MDSKNVDALLTQFYSLVDYNKASFKIALLAIAFNPTAWNIVARNEYRNKTITRIFGGNARYGSALFTIGQLFGVTSTWSLGITGTFLGDYFGILMDHRVEGFPFNVLRDPMYVGSTMCFAATALWYERPAGLVVTLYVYIVYLIALRFEGPFTDMIYSKRAEQAKAKAL
ncbi:phospholipid methyltransferase-domain-containing protein [Flammula alnicola]|nr:phospholipid methyltransferase-domain-containing protein [Flammula alnicola]